MKIEATYNRKKYRYHVRGEDGASIVSLDSLEEAALIKRFMEGGNLPEAEASRALEIMKRLDEERKSKE